MARIAVLFIHGVEIADPDYARTAIEYLRAAFEESAGIPVDEGLVITSAFYAPAFEAREKALFSATGGDGLTSWFGDLGRLASRADQGEVSALLALGFQAARRVVHGACTFRWPLLRWLLINYLGDAVGYQLGPGDRRLYDEVQGLVLDALTDLAEQAGPDAPLCIVAHSLGSVVIGDLLYDLQTARDSGRSTGVSERVSGAASLVRGETLARLYTLGSPIALWTLRSPDDAVAVRVPDPVWREKNPDAPGGWTNIYDGDDVFAYPLAGLYGRAVTDRAVRLRPWWLSWTPAAHPFYWNDRSVVGSIAADLATLRAALSKESADA
jgi:hypothetical protein